MDELDAALLRELQRDARRTNRDVAASVGVSPSTALERVRALRQSGVIRGASLDVDLAALGRPVQAFIAVRIRPPSRPVIEAFRDWSSRLPETPGVFAVSGNEDFLIHIAVADTDGLCSFVIDRLTQRREVADVRTSVVYEHLRTQVVEPLAARPDRRVRWQGPPQDDPRGSPARDVLPRPTVGACSWRTWSWTPSSRSGWAASGRRRWAASG